VLGPRPHIDPRHRAADPVTDEDCLPSGVIATPAGCGPTVMSAGSFVRFCASIVDTVPLPPLVTKAVSRHRARAATADAPFGTTPSSAPANPSPTTPRTHRNRRIAALPRRPHQLSRVRLRSAYAALQLSEWEALSGYVLRTFAARCLPSTFGQWTRQEITRDVEKLSSAPSLR